MKTKITVYIPSHRYGQYLEQAIKSVLAQTLKDWEMIIICDGAIDETESIATKYEQLYPEKIKVLKNEKAKGLQVCANLALEYARGEYIMRLDADDYLDESALLVLSNYLDQNKDIVLVYPNFIYVNKEGRFLAIEDRKRIGQEAKLLDLPAHGACTLIRKRILKSVGGYSEKYAVQDGYDLWLKILHRYPVGNVPTPLFYYRQHGTSQSRNEAKILETRGQIKRDHVKSCSGPVKPKVVAIIGAKNTYQHLPNIALRPIAGKPLIEYTLEAVTPMDVFDKIVVSTDDERVKEYCTKYENVITFMRPPNLSGERITTRDVASDAVEHLEEDYQCHPDIIVYLNIHAPLRRSNHIQKSIDTLILYNTDEVISVYEDFDLHYRHAKLGLKPISKIRHEQLRIEREALYVNNGAVLVAWRDTIAQSETSGIKIGHIVMTRDESFQIKTENDVELIEMLLDNKNKDDLIVEKDQTKTEVQ